MNIQTKGFQQLQKVLETYEKKTAKAAMRKAVRAGTTVLKAAIKSEVPVDKGLLKKAQDMKTINRGMRFTGMAGADVSDLNADHEANNKRPTNIDHLVNFGHLGPDGRMVPPNAYMVRGAAKGMPAAQAKTEAVLRQAIDDLEQS